MEVETDDSNTSSGRRPIEAIEQSSTAADLAISSLSMDVETDDPIETTQQTSTSADLEVSLPSDVLTEILIRLPVRSILRFKSVCKSWYAQFSDPIFVEKHARASIENKDYENHRLIISSIYSKDVKSCSVPYSLLHGEYSVARPIHYPWRSKDAKAWVVGSVNGLVLIIVDRVGVFLWNPALRESRRLLQSGFEKDSETAIAYGFGYDQSSSDYKVMVIETEFVSAASPLMNQARLYELESDSWREIENCPDCELMADFGKFACGALHWPACFETGLNNDHQGILAFDLSKETFYEISQPFLGESYSDSTIGVLDGCLCVLCNSGGTKVDIWVMKEHGKIKSWSMKYSIPSQHDPEHFQFSAPLFIFKNNEVLLMIGTKLMLYNVENNTISRPLIQNFTRLLPRVSTYIETLVSLHHGHQSIKTNHMLKDGDM